MSCEVWSTQICGLDRAFCAMIELFRWTLLVLMLSVVKVDAYETSMVNIGGNPGRIFSHRFSSGFLCASLGYGGCKMFLT